MSCFVCFMVLLKKLSHVLKKSMSKQVVKSDTLLKSNVSKATNIKAKAT